MKATLLILTLGGLLAGAAGVAIYTWDQLSGVAISADGIVALTFGVLASLALGMGLMALIFYSHRNGYDRMNGRRRRPPAPRRGDGGGDPDRRAAPGER